MIGTAAAAAAGSVAGIYRLRSSALNRTLARTAAHTLLFCILLSVGIWLADN